MNKVAMIVIGVGALITLIGIILVTGIEERTEETLEEGYLYEGADGEMEITGKSNPENQGTGYYVHIKGTYEGGGEGGYNEKRGNNTWDLKEEDCNLVKNFTLTHNEDDAQVFIPRCNYIEDDGASAQDDDWIVVGTLCTQQTAGERNRTGDGCPDGTYTWDTGGVEVMVFDLDKLFEGIFGAIITALSSFGACCCGGVVVIIGIILAFTMEDSQSQTFDTSSNHPLINSKDDGFTTYEKKGWDEQEDYIRKDTSEDEITEKEDSEEETKKDRSGEYELPPPPE